MKGSTQTKRRFFLQPEYTFEDTWNVQCRLSYLPAPNMYGKTITKIFLPEHKPENNCALKYDSE